MSSENPIGADNQQERLSGEWVVGFVDGEGCFGVPIYRNHLMTLGWQVRPEFAVAQSASSRSVLDELVSFFGCGKVYLNRRHDNHREDLLRYCVQRIQDLRERIIPFFEEHPLAHDETSEFREVRANRLNDGIRHASVSGRCRRDCRNRTDDESQEAL